MRTIRIMRVEICIILTTLTLSSCIDYEKATDTELRVLQINTWQEATTVPDGFNGLVGIIRQTDADVVLLSEVRNYNNVDFIGRLTDTLSLSGDKYYGLSTGQSAGIISKFEIQNQQSCCENGQGPMVKAYLKIADKNFAIYSAHLDYTHYECYLPRGYSGTSWEKIEKPADDAEYVLEMNRLSQRDEAIRFFMEDAKKEIEKGNLVILGGDFNEPSHLDWQEDTKNMRDHNGLVINWDCSVMLHEMGMIDTFREIYPNAVDYPGFTFPSPNENVPLSKLTWAPEADERDRIDFIYYYPNPNLKLIDSKIVGPSETIIIGEVKPNDSHDKFIEPEEIWPTDHKANFSIFRIKK